MTRQIAGAALLALLAACGGSDSKQPGAFAGTFQVTAVYCNGGPAPAFISNRITAPSVDKWISADGYDIAVTFSDGTCTLGFPFTATYPSSSSISMRGSGGLITCAPSAAACLTFSTSLFGGSVCGATSNDAPMTQTFTTVPTVAGGTMTLTPVGVTVCSDNGLSDPFTQTLTKL